MDWTLRTDAMLAYSSHLVESLHSTVHSASAASVVAPSYAEVKSDFAVASTPVMLNPPAAVDPPPAVIEGLVG
jgi:hypothetical protein